MAVRAILSLAAVLGIFQGGPGRGVLLSAGAFRGNRERLTFPSLAQTATPIVNMIQLGQTLTVRQPPVRALFVYNANPLSTCPDASMVRQGLVRDDLFTVVHEQVMSPTARYADLLLPATTFLENRDLNTAYGQFYLGVAEPVIKPQGEAISNFDLFQTLAGKMGFTDPPFRQSVEERIAGYLKDMEGLPADVPAGGPAAGTWLRSTLANTAGDLFVGGSRGFDFCNDGEPQEPPHACLTEAVEFADPDLLSRYPFQLITPPHADLLNSTFGERYREDSGEVLIHPEDAAIAGIADGERITIANHRGSTGRIARLSTDTRPGLLVAEGLFWPTGADAAGINDLTSQKLSDMGGGATFHESRVAIVGRS
jgi:anaerobic selenocysteine-containing dehydrogenase